jgi:hypothetical protein
MASVSRSCRPRHRSWRATPTGAPTCVRDAPVHRHHDDRIEHRALRVPTIGGGIFWRLSFVSNTQVGFLTGSTSSLGDRGYYLKDLASGALSFVLRDGDGGSTAMLSGDARTVVFSRVPTAASTRASSRAIASPARRRS